MAPAPPAVDETDVAEVRAQRRDRRRQRHRVDVVAAVISCRVTVHRRVSATAPRDARNAIGASGVKRGLAVSGPSVACGYRSTSDSRVRSASMS
jgi:hypothetical protein